jgi:uncharacterized protein
MREIKPALGIWYHQDLNIISPGVGLEGTMRSAYSRLTGIPIKRITGGRYTGVAATWQRNTIKNGMAFVVELGKTLNSDQAKVHSSAVLNISMLLRDAPSSTSLAGVLPISMASILTYWAHDHIDWGVTLWLTIGSVGGALIGARLLAVLPKRVLTLTFVAVLAIAGIRMFFEIDTSGVTVIDAGSAIALVVIGFFVGALAGMLGIGGGLITVPIMIVIFHVPPAVAKGTALAVVIPTALSGTLQNLSNKNADIMAALLVSVTGIFAAVVGGWISSLMSAAVSNFLFAVLLIIIAARMLLQLRKGSATPAVEGAS